jgi:PAS domain S-box-containing protein
MDFEKYKKTIQNLADPIYLCDAAGFICIFNQAAVELWGREPAYGKEMFCAAVRIKNADGTDLQIEKYPIVQSLRFNIPVQSEVVIMERPDGTFRRVIQYTTPIYDIWGKLSGVVNRMLDITLQMDNQAIA